MKPLSAVIASVAPGCTARTMSIAIGTAALLLSGAVQPAQAASRCVNPGGTGGCFSTISAAVAAAAGGDIIRVAHGTYKEDVQIGKPLSLVGEEDENTTIDATGLRNGITITDTFDVIVTGFTVQNADAAGIWVTGSSYITLTKNLIRNNDKSLIGVDNASCPALKGTPFEQGEGGDCGEGVFLSAVNHSILTDNKVTGNAGGLLITDDTGPTFDNLISDNSVVKNTALDCGITLPSHSSAGVYHNTVKGNDSSYNGGPGVGIFAPGPGSKAYGNVVIGNHLVGNGLPGVTMHNHAAPGVQGVSAGAPEPNFDDNLIVGNYLAENAADTEDAATGGTTGINIYSLAPMRGTVISQNVIERQAFDIVIKVPSIGGVPAVQIQLNNLLGNKVGLQNAGTAIVNARENWWGCADGPEANGCASLSGSGVIFFHPWLTKPYTSEELQEK